jgi:hypothetical protein
MEGRALNTLFEGDTIGEKQIGIALPVDLAAGNYWIKLENENGQTGVRGISLVR